VLREQLVRNFRSLRPENENKANVIGSDISHHGKHIMWTNRLWCPEFLWQELINYRGQPEVDTFYKVGDLKLWVASRVGREMCLGSQNNKRTWLFNPLTPNDQYRCRTAPLTSKRRILYIYSTNIGTEYFKQGIYSPSLSLQNAVFFFIILTYLVPFLFVFYIQGVLKLKK